MNVIDDKPQLQAAENDVLSAPFTKKEVHQAITQMKLNKAPGPDGFPAEFYKKWWHIIKDDLMPMFHDFFRWPFGVVSPKRWYDNVITEEEWGGPDRTISTHLPSECEF